ncbi:hypothetical protein GCM10008018_63810 [Paenibacillus marchantiophytorum]|uniref:Uncharacterized protein n=1 Tax=Paenibacillus marchantiophytorum TaxID=1619310 RepID=A0ABQ1FGE1_9BACL|nr:hypothetical protein GCM10008018_63810 [Paenibacillus marchantiophytorum]
MADEISDKVDGYQLALHRDYQSLCLQHLASANTDAKDIYFYTHEGIKIMIKNGWLEEPPQMEDRHQLIHH